MTYLKRLPEGGHSYDWSEPLCGDCLSKRPGWVLWGGPDTTYHGNFDRPWHAHQPEPWCAAHARHWVGDKPFACADCGCDLHEHDDAHWGKCTPGHVRLLAERGLLYQEQWSGPGTGKHYHRMTPADLGDHPELADMHYAELVES